VLSGPPSPVSAPGAALPAATAPAAKARPRTGSGRGLIVSSTSGGAAVLGAKRPSTSGKPAGGASTSNYLTGKTSLSALRQQYTAGPTPSTAAPAPAAEEPQPQGSDAPEDDAFEEVAAVAPRPPAAKPAVAGLGTSSLASLRQQYGSAPAPRQQDAQAPSGAGGSFQAGAGGLDITGFGAAGASAVSANAATGEEDQEDMEQMWENVTAANRDLASQPSAWAVADGQGLVSYSDAWQYMVQNAAPQPGIAFDVAGLCERGIVDKDAMVNVARTRFCDDVMHLRILQSVWKHLAAVDTAPLRIGRHWENIGFQGTDPTTDLRGLGMLGLLHLLLLAERAPRQVSAGIRASRDPTRHFPFAVSSFTFSKRAVEMLLQDGLTPQCNASGGAEEPVASLFVGMFCRLLTRWQQEGLSITHFGNVSKEIFDAAERNPDAMIREGRAYGEN